VGLSGTSRLTKKIITCNRSARFRNELEGCFIKIAQMEGTKIHIEGVIAGREQADIFSFEHFGDEHLSVLPPNRPVLANSSDEVAMLRKQAEVDATTKPETRGRHRYRMFSLPHWKRKKRWSPTPEICLLSAFLTDCPPVGVERA
jgi:hypothetical protein